MKVHRNLDQLPRFRNAVVTIGSFDGVHKGHQKILHRVNDLARQIEGESVVVTFHPHPRQIIYPKDESIRLLTSIEEKIMLFRRYGVRHLVIVPFTVEFSQMSPDEYIEKFLFSKFRPKYLVIGYDHRFGLNRQGDINYLKWFTKDRPCQIVEIEKQAIDDNKISSTRIRRSVEAGEVRKAREWLGHWYFLTGEVVLGQKIGRELGYPTANLRIPEAAKLLPPPGIYAAYAIHREVRYRAMLYIGNRPTLNGPSYQTIEVNLFEFDREIYGEELTVELVDFIRKDHQFGDLPELGRQLQKDKETTLDLLNQVEKETFLVEESDDPRVGIVILNFNGREHLKKYLPSVLGTALRDLQFWVADNGSTDDSLQFLRTYYPNVSIIELEKNFGFAEGYNRAMTVLKNKLDYYVFLNSDVEVSPNWLRPIIDYMEEHPDVGAVQPKIKSLRERNKFEYAGAAGGWIDLLGYPFCRGRILSETEKDTGQYDQMKEIFWSSGAAMVMRANLYHKSGGFDGDYFAHMEEIDLCWRLKRAGYKVLCMPQSHVYHLGGGTLSYMSTRKTFLNFRNSLMTILKNEPAAKLFWLLPARLLLDGLAALLFLSQGKPDHLFAILRAHFSFYRQLPAVLRKRRDINRWVERNRIQSRPNQRGIFAGSIAWNFFILKKRTFQKIVNR